MKKYLFCLLILTAVAFLSSCSTGKQAITQKDIEALRVKYYKGRMGSINELIYILRNKNLPYEVRLKALDVLAETKHPDAEKAIRDFVSDALEISYEMLLQAADRLSQGKDPQNVEALVKGLVTAQGKYVEYRTQVMKKLSGMQPEIEVESLLDLYESERKDYIKYQESLTKLLGNLGDDRVIPILIDIARNPENNLSTRSLAIEILSRKDDPTITEAFIDMLQDPETQLKFKDFALQAMDDVPTYKMITALSELYKVDKEEHLILLEKLTEAVKDVNDTALVPILTDIALSEIYPYKIRENAILSLVKFRDKEVFFKLLPLLEDARNYVLYDAIYQMARELNDKEVLDKLRETELKAQKSIFQGIRR
ncbi:MAG: HEAT repeat domain-containing protein [Candidatus Marinimicrobia bacterium]|nr:HEAT repeat domain-containing protein [Candidatus Neomarinimicrobiota bacterium]